MQERERAQRLHKLHLYTGEGKGNLLMSLMLRLSSRLNGKSKQASDIRWNFEKFLIDRKGNVVKRFAPVVTPDQIAGEIEQLL